MKKTLIALLAATSLLSVYACANNQQPPQGEPPAFDDMDTNGDGELQQDELRGPLADHFSEFDRDGSGGLSESELPPPPPAREQ